MRSKKKPQHRSRLCVIIDLDVLDKQKAVKAAAAAASAGADMLQLRCKHLDTVKAIAVARNIKSISKKWRIPLVINDRAEVAVAIDADGLHIGRGDIGAELAGRILKKGSMLGVSAQTLREARSAKNCGAGYLGVGPIFKTPIKGFAKPIGIGMLRRVKSLGIPFFAIGGIDSDNIGILVSNGFRSIAVIRAVLKAGDPFKATFDLKRALAR